MSRFEDTKAPFGGSSYHTAREGFRCGWCGTHYRKSEQSMSDTGPMHLFHFGNLEIAECCFGKLEDAIVQHMEDILPWYARLLRKRQEVLDKHRGMLRQLTLLPELQNKGSSESS